MRPVGECIHLFQHAEEIGLRYHQRGEFAAFVLLERFRNDVAAFHAQRHFHELDVLVRDDGAHHADGISDAPLRGIRILRDLLMGTHRHQHRLGQRRGAVVERGVRDVHAGQRGHHGLVFVQQLQRALAGLGLVRRVGGVELAARDDLPHRRRNMVLVRAGADEIGIRAVLVSARSCIRRVTSISLRPSGTCVSLPARSSAGISSNRSSIDLTPMPFSIALMSASVCGINGMA